MRFKASSFDTVARGGLQGLLFEVLDFFKGSFCIRVCRCQSLELNLYGMIDAHIVTPRERVVKSNHAYVLSFATVRYAPSVNWLTPTQCMNMA